MGKDLSYTKDPDWIKKQIEGCKREIARLAASIKEHEENLKRMCASDKERNIKQYGNH